MLDRLNHLVLTPAEERELAQRRDRGDSSAKNEFILSNLRLVRSLIPAYRGRGLDDDDLFQEGVAGLMRAVEKFDYRKGFKFSTYALPWIRQAMRRATADQGKTIRIPVHIVERQSALERAAQAIESQHGRKATMEELADATGLSVRHVANAVSAPSASVSLSQRVKGDDEAELGDFIADARVVDPAEQVQLREELRSAFDGTVTAAASVDTLLKVFVENDNYSPELDTLLSRAEAKATKERKPMPRSYTGDSVTCALCGRSGQPSAGKIFFSAGSGRSSRYSHHAHIGTCCLATVRTRFEERRSMPRTGRS